MEIKLKNGFAKSPEIPHRGVGEITCLKTQGLYNLKIDYFWVVENKKRLSTVNKWLREHDYKTVFVEEQEG